MSGKQHKRLRREGKPHRRETAAVILERFARQAKPIPPFYSGRGA